MLQLKRVYDELAANDGFRVLVDRLWPRGVGKEQAAVDLWLKDIAPSPDLRTWFGHDPAKFAEFTARYISELVDNPAVETLRDLTRQHSTVTLLYAAKDPDANHAVVLKDFMQGR